jgi:hypothetical protein
VRLGEATARFISLAGTRRLLATVDDVTEQHRLDDERAAGVTAYRAVTQLAVLLLGGHPVLKSIGSVLPELRRSGGFQTTLLWNLKLGRPVVADGDKPPHELGRELSRGQPLPEGVVRLGPAARGAATGWAVQLASTGHSVILLGPASHSPSTQALFTGMLADLAALASAGG